MMKTISTLGNLDSILVSTEELISGRGAQPLPKNFSALSTAEVVGALLSLLKFNGLDISNAQVVVDGQSVDFSSLFSLNGEGDPILSNTSVDSIFSYIAENAPTEEPDTANVFWKQGGFLMVSGDS